MSELAEFLEEQPAEAPPEATPPEEVPTGEQVPPEAETPPAEEQPPEEPEGSPPEPEDASNDKSVPIAALLDEREKRQATQRELEELRKRIDEKPETVPDVLDDQEGFVASMRSEMNQQAFSIRAEVSQEMMRTLHDDYDDVETKFLDMAAENPELAQGMSSAALPAKFVYETVKKAEKLAQMENVDEFEAKTRAEIEAKVRAEMEAEFKEKAKADAEQAASITPSISGVTADGGNTPPAVKIEDPLETTFNR